MTRLTNKEKSLSFAMILLIIVIIAISLSSCGVNYHSRMAAKHIRKAELKGATITTDTVFKTITVTTKEVKTDTVFTSLPGDTVTIQKDKLKIKYVKLPADSVYIFGECQPDTVKIKVPYTVTKEIKAGHGFWFDAKLVLIAAIAGFILSAIFWVTVRAWLKSIL